MNKKKCKTLISRKIKQQKYCLYQVKITEYVT